MGEMYHEGNRGLQDRFDTRRLADRIGNLLVHDAFTERDRAFVESRDMFFLATADEHGRPNVSYKGGDPGFVRVVDEHTLAFPNYNGNGDVPVDGEPAEEPRTSGSSSSTSRDATGCASTARPRSTSMIS